VANLPSLGPRGEGWVAIQGVLLVLVATAGWSLGPDWSGAPRLIGIVVGILLIGSGLLLVVRGVIDLGGALSPLPRPRADTKLVEAGAYAVIRHPVYAGLILASFGWAMAQASVMALVLAAALAAFFWLKSAREEMWLERHFPDYAAYRGRTGRFVPRFGRTRG
jgi:protein-S-isoprenylcysteine O-methyltransferase Ste14